MNAFLKSKIIETIKNPNNTIKIKNHPGVTTYTINDANNNVLMTVDNGWDYNIYSVTVRNQRALHVEQKPDSHPDKKDVFDIIDACQAQFQKQAEAIKHRNELNKARLELNKAEEKILNMLGYTNITPLKEIDEFKNQGR